MKIEPIVSLAGAIFSVNVKRGREKFALENIYASLYEKVPWPEHIPRPEEVSFEWSYRATFSGRCWPQQKFIEISCLYKHRWLHAELVHLMAHEIAHFIWQNGHPKEFRRFLKSVGVSNSYSHFRRPIASSLYNGISDQFLKPRYTWKCASCGTIVQTKRRVDSSCGRCDPKKFNSEFRLKLVNSLLPLSDRLKNVFGEAEIVD